MLQVGNQFSPCKIRLYKVNIYYTEILSIRSHYLFFFSTDQADWDGLSWESNKTTKLKKYIRGIVICGLPCNLIFDCMFSIFDSIFSEKFAVVNYKFNQKDEA